MEKADNRPRLYIGSDTDKIDGLATRFNQYKEGHCIPQYLLRAQKDGFEITHQELLC